MVVIVVEVMAVAVVVVGDVLVNRCHCYRCRYRRGRLWCGVLGGKGAAANGRASLVRQTKWCPHPSTKASHHNTFMASRDI